MSRALLVAAVGIDRIHDQRGLHRHHRAIARIDPFNLARDKAVSHIAGSKTAEGFGQGDAQTTRQRPCQRRPRVRPVLRHRRPSHAWGQLICGEGAGRLRPACARPRSTGRKGETGSSQSKRDEVGRVLGFDPAFSVHGPVSFNKKGAEKNGCRVSCSQIPDSRRSTSPVRSS